MRDFNQDNLRNELPNPQETPIRPLSDMGEENAVSLYFQHYSYILYSQASLSTSDHAVRQLGQTCSQTLKAAKHRWTSEAGWELRDPREKLYRLWETSRYNSLDSYTYCLLLHIFLWRRLPAYTQQSPLELSACWMLVVLKVGSRGLWILGRYSRDPLQEVSPIHVNYDARPPLFAQVKFFWLYSHW